MICHFRRTRLVSINTVLTLPDSAPGSIVISADFATTTSAVPEHLGGLLGNLSLNQQLELIYSGFYNRAADEGGFSFFGANETNAGQRTKRVAGVDQHRQRFRPAAGNRRALPILGAANLDLQTAAAQASLTTFIGNVYGNLFDPSRRYRWEACWVGRSTSGAVGLGFCALAIANGATGADAIEVQTRSPWRWISPPGTCLGSGRNTAVVRPSLLPGRRQRGERAWMRQRAGTTPWSPPERPRRRPTSPVRRPPLSRPPARFSGPLPPATRSRFPRPSDRSRCRGVS